MPASRRGGAVAIALVGVIVGALLVWCGGDDKPRAAAVTNARARDVPAAARREAFEPPVLPEARPALAGRAAAGAPIIDSVTLEKPEVCEGEDTLVMVEAHAPDAADDAHLHYLVAGETGAAVPIVGRRRESDSGAPPARRVIVFGRDNVATEVVMPEPVVKPCRVARRVQVMARVLPNTIDEYELHARVVDVAASAKMTPVEARWDFGDGTTLVSAGPTVTHDYGGRAQDAMYTQVLVRVEVVGADGEVVVGRAALQLANPSFEHRQYRGLVLLYAQPTPRFPERDARGVVAQTVRVWHRDAQPVTVTAVWRREHFLPDATTSEPEAIDPVALFGKATLAPGEVLEARVALDTVARPDTFAVEYVVEGTSADGLPAQGAFSVLKPPELPTAANSDAVTDPLLKAKILRARELLGKDYVTDEDLWALDRDGKFADLVAPVAPTLPASGAGAGSGAGGKGERLPVELEPAR